ncbi:hypothetical protein [Bizionia sp.]|uniref:hypothetical protein n=1 Tax=Flavobacteriaceae TaxID=49546 RepID=UPI003A8E2028
MYFITKLINIGNKTNYNSSSQLSIIGHHPSQNRHPNSIWTATDLKWTSQH